MTELQKILEEFDNKFKSHLEDGREVYTYLMSQDIRNDWLKKAFLAGFDLAASCVPKKKEIPDTSKMELSYSSLKASEEALKFHAFNQAINQINSSLAEKRKGLNELD